MRLLPRATVIALILFILSPTIARAGDLCLRTTPFKVSS